MNLCIILIYLLYFFKGVYFPEGSPDGQKLNVEEKKPRVRSNTESRTNNDASGRQNPRGPGAGQNMGGQNARTGGRGGPGGQNRQSAGYQRGNGQRVAATGNYNRR